MFALVPIINKQNPKRIGCNNEELYVLSLYFLLLLWEERKSIGKQMRNLIWATQNFTRTLYFDAWQFVFFLVRIDPLKVNQARMTGLITSIARSHACRLCDWQVPKIQIRKVDLDRSESAVRGRTLGRWPATTVGPVLHRHSRTASFLTWGPMVQFVTTPAMHFLLSYRFIIQERQCQTDADPGWLAVPPRRLDAPMICVVARHGTAAPCWIHAWQRCSHAATAAERKMTPAVDRLIVIGRPSSLAARRDVKKHRVARAAN
jgi:hypothetical protein